MRVISPVTVTDGMLKSSNVGATTQPAWSSAATYSVGAKVQVGTRIYQSLQASNLNKTPADTANASWWADIGPTNRWAMFDSEINTQTVVTDAVTSSASLVVSITPGLVNSIALLELSANTVKVEVFESSTSTDAVYSKLIALDYTDIQDWYAYFFEPTSKMTLIHLEDLPPYSSGVIKVTVSGGSEVRCGALVVGNVVDLGDTRYGASIGINDFSKKSTNDFGVTTLVKRAYSNRANFSFVVKTRYLDRVKRTLADLRATNCLWVGIASNDYTITVIFGFYKEFSLDLATRDLNYCSLSIEGMI